jgi:hypothetical protein
MMANTVHISRLENPKAFIRHNIEVLRQQGRDDDYIAVVLRIPLLLRGEYGLQCRKSAVKIVDPQTLIKGINTAIGSPEDVPIHDLLIRLGTSIDRVRTQRKHCPELDAALKELASSNRRKRLSISASRSATQKGVDMAASYAAGHQLLDNSPGQNISIRELCAEMRRSSGWLHLRTHLKDERAIELHARWKKHNQQAKQVRNPLL